MFENSYRLRISKITKLHRNYRKPLIVAGPKALLRLPQAVSRLSDMAPNTSFLPVIDDTSVNKTESVSRVCFMSGKIYYDLFKERERKNAESEIALIR